MSDAWLEDLGARRDEPLARHSQYGIGGPADWFVQLDNAAQLQQLVRDCHEHELALTVIGAGSNSLIQDGGIRGVVLEYTDAGMSTTTDTVTMGAGRMMPRAALDLARLGLGGMEFGIGIPGSCGASIRGNAGAFGREIRDALIDCTVVTDAAVVENLTAAQCNFGFRTSSFKQARAHDIVVSARFAVTADEPAAVRERTDAIQAQRKATQPYGIRSLGSVFTNPPGESCGRLIEACDLKGRRVGGAEISTKHANFIVNRDHASAADVLALVELAHTAVIERFGIDLVPEIAVLGVPLTQGAGR